MRTVKSISTLLLNQINRDVSSHIPLIEKIGQEEKVAGQVKGGRFKPGHRKGESVSIFPMMMMVGAVIRGCWRRRWRRYSPAVLDDDTIEDDFTRRV